MSRASASQNGNGSSYGSHSSGNKRRLSAPGRAQANGDDPIAPPMPQPLKRSSTTNLEELSSAPLPPSTQLSSVLDSPLMNPGLVEERSGAALSSECLVPVSEGCRNSLEACEELPPSEAVIAAVEQVVPAGEDAITAMQPQVQNSRGATTRGEMWADPASGAREHPSLCQTCWGASTRTDRTEGVEPLYQWGWE